MIGTRIGTKIGAAIGAAIGTVSDPLGGIVLGVPTDASSGKGVPLTLADYALATSKVPAHTWGFQDASGAIVASVGTNLTVTGTVEYQQAVSGWTRTAVQFTATANERAAHAVGVGANPATQSVAWFAYIDVTATPGATALIGAISDGATLMNMRITNTPRLQLNCAGNLGTGTADPVAGGVHPLLAVYDRTNSVAKFYSDQEIITATFAGTVVDGNKGYGAGGAGTPAAHLTLLGAMFTGSNAEFTDAQARSFLQALNWTIPW